MQKDCISLVHQLSAKVQPESATSTKYLFERHPLNKAISTKLYEYLPSGTTILFRCRLHCSRLFFAPIPIMCSEKLRNDK